MIFFKKIKILFWISTCQNEWIWHLFMYERILKSQLHTWQLSVIRNRESEMLWSLTVMAQVPPCDGLQPGQRHSTQITSEYPQDACEVVYETEWILCLHFRKSWWYSVSYNTNIPTPNAWNLKCFQSQRFQIKVSQTMYFQSPKEHSVSCLRSLQNCHIHKPSIEAIFPSLWRELCVCSPALILPSVSLLPLLPFYRLLNLGPG